MVWRRTDKGKKGFIQEAYKGLEPVVSLEEIDASLSLAALYEGVQFTRELDE